MNGISLPIDGLVRSVNTVVQEIKSEGCMIDSIKIKDERRDVERKPDRQARSRLLKEYSGKPSNL
jgi:hypothetical protein